MNITAVLTVHIGIKVIFMAIMLILGHYCLNLITSSAVIVMTMSVIVPTAGLIGIFTIINVKKLPFYNNV